MAEPAGRGKLRRQEACRAGRDGHQRHRAAPGAPERDDRADARRDHVQAV